MSIRIVLLVCVLALVACSKEGGSASGPAAPQDPAKPRAALPAALHLATAPSPAASVADVRKLDSGADVVVVGRVKDIVATRAVFTIADLSLKSCAEPGDSMNCATPWDYCCEDRERLAAGVATIEIRDGDAPLQGTVQFWNGLDHLKQVVVAGRLVKDEKGNASVIASGIYVGS